MHRSLQGSQDETDIPARVPDANWRRQWILYAVALGCAVIGLAIIWLDSQV